MAYKLLKTELNKKRIENTLFGLHCATESFTD